MEIVRRQFRTLRDLALHYGRRPGRLGELTRWAADRGATTVERRLPWWPYAAAATVSAALPPSARVFEYGGGGSTLWLADRGAEVTVAEHDRQWGELLRTELGERARIRVVEPVDAGLVSSRHYPGRFFDDYVRLIDAEPDGSLDLVIVDGRARVECGLRARAKVRPGGMLLLDDSDRERYATLARAMEGWEETVVRGARPGGGPVFQTTIWRRSLPAAA